MPLSRRRFFYWALGAGSCAAAAAACGCGSGGTAPEGTGIPGTSGTLVDPPGKVNAGPLADFPAGGVETKFVGSWEGFFLVQHADMEDKSILVALKANCTHLGSHVVKWEPEKERFKCSSCGSGYYKNGINFEGPAPRPLERFAIRVDDKGSIEVDLARTFHEELGEWTDPASFVVFPEKKG